jgi:sarcosine oxidase
LSAGAVHDRFPAFTLPNDTVGFFEPRAGVLDPEGCVDAHLRLAQEAGAEVHPNESVEEWSVSRRRVRVITGQGEYDAGRLALCAGAWTPQLLDEDLPLQVERQVMHWFAPARDRELLSISRCPIAMTEYAPPDRIFYFVPDNGNGVKAAIHHEGELTHPDRVRRDVAPSEVDAVRSLLAKYLPGANGELRGSATCLYTDTPDGHFLFTAHSRYREVLVVSACSGHGFKFASAVGEAVADLLMGMPRPDLAAFGRDRLVSA